MTIEEQLENMAKEMLVCEDFYSSDKLKQVDILVKYFKRCYDAGVLDATLPSWDDVQIAIEKELKN